MNREWVLFNLREAAGELSRTIAEIDADSDYDYAHFSVAMKPKRFLVSAMPQRIFSMLSRHVRLRRP